MPIQKAFLACFTTLAAALILAATAARAKDAEPPRVGDRNCHISEVAPAWVT